MAKGGKFLKQSAKKRSNGARVVLIVLIVLVSLLLALLLGGMFYYETLMGGINRFEEDSTTPSGDLAEVLGSDYNPETIDPSATDATEWVPVESGSQFGDSEEIVNILLIGQDSRNSNVKGLADSMILCSINKDTKKLVMTSFLRDMWVQIPSQEKEGSYFYERINTAYPTGGYKALSETLLHNFGVVVDHCVEIDFSGFQEVVDAMGGVDIELTKSEARHMNNQYGWGSRLSEGLQHLNGEEALAYARIRKIDSDFGRANRQRVVLEKLLEKVKTMNLSQANKLVQTVIPLITTNMTNGEITQYVVDLLPMLMDLELITQTIPAEGAYRNVNKGTEEEPKYVLSVDFEKNRELLRNTIGVEAAE